MLESADLLRISSGTNDKWGIPDKTWDALNLPFASQQVLDYRCEMSALRHVLADCFDDGPKMATLRREGRSGQQRRQHYWTEMAKLAAPRDPTVALHALDKLEAFGGFKRRILLLREDIAARSPDVIGR
jgi:hypothetical protein